MQDKESSDLNPKREEGRRSDPLNWLIVVCGIAVLIVTVLWFIEVLRSKMLFRLSVAAYCLMLGVVFILKRILPVLSRNYTKKALLFYFIAGIISFLATLFVLVITFVIG